MLESAMPSWDPAALASELRKALGEPGRQAISLRGAAAQAGVSPATFSRAATGQGWPELSHTNWLKLRAWLDRRGEKAAA